MDKLSAWLVVVVCGVTYCSIQSGVQEKNNDVETLADDAKSVKRRLVGRHVCTRSKVVMTTVNDMQSYCKPSYQTYLRRCITGATQLCTGYRVVYELAYRPAQRIVAQTKTTYVCCPGWTHSRQSADDCKRPLCTKSCQNGGSCVKPDHCVCAPGWTGHFCESDVDECHTQGHIFCEHSCVNMRGSFRCSCRDNYVLQPDGRSCKPATESGIKMQAKLFSKDLDEMNRKIQRLEQHVSGLLTLKSRVDSLTQLLHHNLKTLGQWNERGVSADRPTENSPSTASSESTDERINSLSEQIAILEERLAECSCSGAGVIQYPSSVR